MLKYLPWLTLIILFGCNPDEKGNQPLFSKLPSTQTHVTFANLVRETEQWNIIKYLNYYNGGGVAVGDINNDGLPDIYFTANQLPNILYLNKGNFQFEDITEKAGVAGHHGERAWKTGVTMADVNGDGWLDIYVSQVGFYKAINGRNELYINNRDSTFSERAAEFGLDFKGFSQQAAFFDYDLDGDLDMFLLNHSVHSSETFSKSENRIIRDAMSGDRLYRNEGGTFTDVSEEAGIFGGPMGYGLGVVTADFNNDGWPDIYVGNDFHENDYLYYNDGRGGFNENIKNSVGHTSTFSMGCDAADLDNDGWLDLVTLDMRPEDEAIFKASAGIDHYNLYQHKLNFGYHYQFPRNCLQWNRGTLAAQPPDPLKGELPRAHGEGGGPPFRGLGGGVSFSEIAQLSGIAATDWSWGPLIADFDGDGWKDIFVTNGIWRRPNDMDYLKFASDKEVQRSASDLQLASIMPPGIVPNYAFKNREGLTFEDVSEKWGLDLAECSNGAAYADFDNDGDLDLVLNNWNAEATIYRNNSDKQNDNNWLKIRLIRNNKNKFGIGARVTLKTDGKEIVGEVSPSRGWQSCVGHELVFGLGNAEKVDTLIVRWGGNDFQILEIIPANQSLLIEEKTDDFEPPISKKSPLFKDISAAFQVPFSHRENRFVDYNIEPLLPGMLSTEGPKIAVGDVNGDGLDDFFVGGAKAQAGALFIQKKGSQFPLFQKDETSAPLFESDKMSEDTDATFFDADGDGDFDLYVVSGGGEYREGSENLGDRLYKNNGKGIFEKAEKALPDFFANGSCVVAADFDGDGLADLFVGSRSVPAAYGLSPKNYLLLNVGGGTFRDATETWCPDMSNLGMVTDAVWLEKTRQLVVVGEWMPVAIFDFKNRPARKTEMENSAGWWKSIAATDFDGDGDDDLLVGNLGLNSGLRATPEEPVRLYVKDFDGNLQTDPVMTFSRDGEEYLWHIMDDLVAQIPPLRRVFTQYTPFAKSTFGQIFPPETLTDVRPKEAHIFQSVYIENDRGSFEIRPLPLTAQVAPIQSFLTGDFDRDGHVDALAVGNFFNFRPGIGKTDASYGCFLKGDGEEHFSAVEARQSGFSVVGDARDIKSAKSRDGREVIIVSRNNDSLTFFISNANLPVGE